MSKNKNTNAQPRVTKSQTLISLLQTGKGVSLEEMVQATGWLPHTVRAAMTGHLVLSTLHTNDAPATLVRLSNMGVALCRRNTVNLEESSGSTHSSPAERRPNTLESASMSAALPSPRSICSSAPSDNPASDAH